MKCQHCNREVPSAYCSHCGKAAKKMKMTKRAKIGCALIAAPWVGFVLILIAYAIASYFTAAAGGDVGLHTPLIDAVHAAPLTTASSLMIEDTGPDISLATTVGQLVRVMLGFFGVLCVLGFFVCTPIGIYFLATADKDEQEKKEKREKK